jgi:GNAT superfamily N-acetyltransferase
MSCGQNLKKGLVIFFDWAEGDGTVRGARGIQHFSDTTLIRHAYVRTEYQRRGIGSTLFEHLLSLARTPEILVGTWAAATWAIQFYKRCGFVLVSPAAEKDRLPRQYWNIHERQVETSVVLRRER